MLRLFLDTHVVIWLFQREPSHFSKTALHLIDTCDDIFLPTISVLELQLLYEIGRITVEPRSIIDDLQEIIGLQLLNYSFKDLVFASLSVDWTRDPFDRLIVSETVLNKAKLLTKDEKILNNFSNAIW